MSNFEGIVSAKIRGFQSHEETTISFHPNLNCIIGATDSGKSSILRALRLVIENKPSGNSFIRNGFDTASVEVSFSDTTVSRNKGATNSYVIDGEVLKAFGQSVPDTVANKLRIDPDLSIQKQSSPYFLLGNTESERAKLVDSFCDISLASLSVANARRNALRADKQADSLRVSLTPLKAKQGALNTFAENKELVDRIERGATKLDTVSKTVTSLTELQARYQKSNATYNLIAGIGDFDVSAITLLVAEYQQVIQTITKLQEFSRKLAIAIPEFRMDDSIADDVTT
jgi:DNA repair exonuclease SbcCD ATPase subunit